VDPLEITPHLLRSSSGHSLTRDATRCIRECFEPIGGYRTITYLACPIAGLIDSVKRARDMAQFQSDCIIEVFKHVVILTLYSLLFEIGFKSAFMTGVISNLSESMQ